MKKFMFIFLILITQACAGQKVTYKVEGEEYESYWVKKSDSAPTVFMIHDWDGLTEYEVKRSHMLKDLGYSIFSIDLFGKGIRPTEVKDKKQHTGELYKNRKKMRALMNSAIEQAKKVGLNTDNAVAMGYCFGGAAILEWARSGADLKGFFSFHGGLQTPKGQSYKNTKGKVVIFHGTADKMITMEHFGQLGAELEQNKVDHEMITYGGAPHAFTVFGSPRYQEKADKASWARFTDILKTVTK
jgi:dienelactone hydrolase